MDLVVGAVVGSGIAAHAAEVGGADFLLAINAGRLRNMGAPSIASTLPTHDADTISIDVAMREILPRAQVPVFLGVNCWARAGDPVAPGRRAREMGFAGVVNFPPVMLLSASLREVLATVGIDADREIEILRAAQDLGLESLYYCGSAEEARRAAEAGLRNILYNFGWNVGGRLGHEARMSLEEAGAIAHSIGRLIKRVDPTIRFFLEGGPIDTSDDLAHVALHAPIDGYVGGSTLDRLPFEAAVANRIAGYKQAGEARRQIVAADQEVLDWSRPLGFVGRAPCLIAFLKTLRKMCASAHPLRVVCESGLDDGPVIGALSKGAGEAVRIVDAAQESLASHAVRRLLGHQRGDLTTLGLLTDPTTRVVVLRNAHLIPRGGQRRLAMRLRRETVAHPKTRAPLKLTARLVVIDEGGADAAALVPELSALLEGWTLTYPPVRARSPDIVGLIAARMAGVGRPPRQVPRFSAAAVQVLRGHLWAANDLEIDRVVGVMTSLGHDGELNPEDVRGIIGNAAGALAGATVLDAKTRLIDALWRNGFHRGKTAAALGISRKTLYNRMRRYGVTG
ncbi:phosphoenolpyruvate hydrolase family protein [Stappia indica]|uniref:phosphoenolpyruvate hydrolase family protein n=1 Tax=Stappia indica TaxID=538381 RepID=UPI001CD28365|nr:phosphoenolpyruvate hydrolase family protein [Stappia indica]MCA1296733.1 phosphoenolpyruvate hydrolase family protein [Stappia indica]